MGKEKDIIAKENIDNERLQFCGNGKWGGPKGVCVPEHGCIAFQTALKIATAKLYN